MRPGTTKAVRSDLIEMVRQPTRGQRRIRHREDKGPVHRVPWSIVLHSERISIALKLHVAPRTAALRHTAGALPCALTRSKRPSKTPP